MIVMKPTATEDEIQAVIDRIESRRCQRAPSRGEEVTVIGAIGDREHVARLGLEGAPGVDKVVPILKPYKLASAQLQARPAHRPRDRRRARSAASTSRSSPARARSSRATRRSTPPTPSLAAGATMFRGGAYKPRTSPVRVPGARPGGPAAAGRGQGAHRPADRHRADGRRATSTPSLEVADVIQLGARNMQNYTLLSEVGRSGCPVLHQARPVRDARGAADGRRVRAQGGQRGGDALRARHPHVRDRLPLHARPDGHPGPQGAHPPAGHRRPAATPPVGATSSSRCRWPPLRRAPTASSSRRTPSPRRRSATARRQLRGDDFAAYADAGRAGRRGLAGQEHRAAAKTA